MNDFHLEEMRDYLDGRLPVGRLAGLERLLETDAGARARFRALATLEEGLSDLAAMPLPATTPAKTRFSRAMLRPLAAAAAGLVIGAFGTSAVWAYAGPFAARAVDLLREGFEFGPPPLAQGIPIEPGRWSGDYAEIVGERGGVTPAGGSRMLQFLRADYEGKTSTGSYIADMHQLIDLRPLRKAFADGGAVVQVSARFNAEPFPDEEAYRAGLSLFALEAGMALDGSLRSDNVLMNESVAMSRERGTLLDRDSTSWQTVVGELRLPPHADFILIRLGMSHANNSQRRETFEGHYADDIRVTIARRAPLP